MRPLLAAAALLLAGCASSGGHDAHGDKLEAIVGVQNLGASEATFILRVVPPEPAFVTEHDVVVRPGRTVERVFALAADGAHRAEAAWRNGTAADPWEPRTCASYHVVFVVDPADAEDRADARRRECH